MAGRWTPRRTITLRRLRVLIVALAVLLTSGIVFAVTARKTVALEVNGEKRTVTTYAPSVSSLLHQQGVAIKTHDLVQSTSGESLKDNTVVTVKSAYQTTVTINGQPVAFWTVADSASQLLSFFEANQVQANAVTVDVSNIYNQLTGGITINTDGPVTVIADGKTSVAPDGDLTAASILDSKGITVGKDDRVTVQKDGDKTILRVQRITYGEETSTDPIAFSTRTIDDPTLPEGTTQVQQEGQDGEKRTTYRVTYADGVEESRTVTSEKTVKEPLDRIVLRGTAKPVTSDESSDSSKKDDSNATQDSSNDSTDSKTTDDSNKNDSSDNTNQSDNTANSENLNSNTTQDESSKQEPSATPSNSPSAEQTTEPTPTPTTTSTPTPTPTQTATPTPTPTVKPTPTPTPTQTQQPSNSGNSSSSTTTTPSANYRLYRPSVSAAQTYAAGAAAQYGWTGDNWNALVKLWNRESGWNWSATNPSSGAYGIPQSLPASKMAAYGEYKNDGAAQIDWGLNYIATQYGSPLKAWQHSEDYGWY